MLTSRGLRGARLDMAANLHQPDRKSLLRNTPDAESEPV